MRDKFYLITWIDLETGDTLMERCESFRDMDEKEKKIYPTAVNYSLKRYRVEEILYNR